MPFYAVARGNEPGVYKAWSDCQAQIDGFKGARYKKFDTEEEAEEFVQENKANAPVVDKRADKDSDSENKGEKRKHDDDDDSDEEGTKKLAADDKGVNKDDEGYVIAYIDGVCFFNGKAGQVAGCGVYFGEDHDLNVSEPVNGKTLTANVAELQAATFAVKAAKSAGFDKLSIMTKSQFMINCMTSWIKGWKKKGWVKGDGETVKNKEELIALDEACDGLALKWVQKKGEPGNSGAEKLSRPGAKRYKAPSDD